MNSNHSVGKATKIYGSVAIVLALVAILLRCLNLSFFYDSVIGYYQSDALLPILEWLTLTAGAVFGLAFAYASLRKAPVTYAPKAPLAVKIVAAVAALGFLALAAATLPPEGAILPALLSLGACVYFLLIVSGVNKPLPLTLTGLCMIVRLLWVMADSYFNLNIPMNTPGKMILHLACLGGMLFTVEELRVLVSSVRPAFYRFSLVFALLFTGTASLPTLILHYAKILENEDLVPVSIALFSLFLYTLVRLICLSFFSHTKESATETLEKITEEATEDIPLPEEVPETEPEESDPQT